MIVRAPLQLTFDPHSREVYVGKWQAEDIYYNYPFSEKAVHLKQEVLLKNNIVLKSEVTRKLGHKNLSHEVASYLGARFYAQLRAVSRAAWITPVEHYLAKYCYYRMGGTSYYHRDQTRRLWKIRPLVKMVYEDQIHHLGALVVYFMASPQQLKKQLGKTLWRWLSHNSYSYNLKLTLRLMQLDEFDGLVQRQRTVPFQHEAMLRKKGLLLGLAKIKRSFITQAYFNTFFGFHECDYYDMNEHEYASDRPEYIANATQRFYADLANRVLLCQWLGHWGRVSHPLEIESLKNLAKDTQAMRKTLGEGFSFQSPKKMKISHDKCQRRLQKQLLEKQVEDKVRFNRRFLYIDKFEHVIATLKTTEQQVEITLLDTMSAIVLEGRDMVHCVARFAEGAATLGYLIFSLKSPRQRTTLSFKKVSALYEKGQHYGYDNEEVHCSQLKTLAKKILHQINAACQE